MIEIITHVKIFYFNITTMGQTEAEEGQQQQLKVYYL
jgi:hypothetical protein